LTDKTTLTLPGGITLEGNAEEIGKLLKVASLDHHIPGYYYSESKGTWEQIATMHPNFLRNAIAKKIRVWAAGLKDMTPAKCIEEISNGSKDLEFNEMASELYRRFVTGELDG